MNILVFSGPSLPLSEARQEIDAVFLPPVSEGDIYRATFERPDAIGIIDGYFENVPAVWHKEILYALQQGIHVFGSASMGALRAAELEPFGMEGVGAVFEAYRDGRLEDDDEVAVIHGPAEFGYLPLSEAMVNIRRTLSDAFDAGVISQASHEALETIAKNLPYRERAYATILKHGRAEGIIAEELDRFEFWLPAGRFDQKSADARLMLQVMRARFRHDCEPKTVHFHFEHTTLWEQEVKLTTAPRDGR